MMYLVLEVYQVYPCASCHHLYPPKQEVFLLLSRLACKSVSARKRESLSQGVCFQMGQWVWHTVSYSELSAVWEPFIVDVGYSNN